MATVGAVALRLSVFSPDAICGITPIELMLEINEIDQSRPPDARSPDRAQACANPVPSELLAQAVARARHRIWFGRLRLVPIETPLTFSGFHQSVLREFGRLLDQLGFPPCKAAPAERSTPPSRRATGRIPYNPEGSRGRAGLRRHECHRLRR
jgi:hypothetical protein